MAENYTLYTEVDPNSHISPAATTITLSGLPRNEDAYLYRDFGTGAWDGDFRVDFDFNISSSSSNAGICEAFFLSNAVDDVNGTHTDYLSARLYPYNEPSWNVGLFLTEKYSGTIYSTNNTDTGLALDTTYYARVKRIGTAFTYVVYASSANRSSEASPLVSLSLTLNGTVAFRYFFPVCTYNSTHVNAVTGTLSNHDIAPVFGTIAFTEGDDTVAISASTSTSGTIAFTEGDDTVSIAATINSPVATIAFTEENDTIAINAILTVPVTVAFTEGDDTVAVTAGVPTTGYVSINEGNDTVSVLSSASTITEPFSTIIRHKTTGANITGLTTVYLKINQPSTGYRWDFSDNSFKATPTTETLVLAEVSAANQPGLYRSLVTTTTWSGWVEFEAYYNDGVFIYSFPGEGYYSNGVRANGSWSVVEIASVAAIKADTAQILLDVADTPTLAEIEGSTIVAKEATVDTLSGNIELVKGYVDELESRLTAIRAGNLDNLDATVSSIATQSSVNAIPTNPLLTNDSRLDNLGITVGSNQVTITVKDINTSLLLPDVGVTVKNYNQSLVLNTGVTSSSGSYVTSLDDGTYNVLLRKSFVDFTVPEVMTVSSSGSTTFTFWGSGFSPSTPSQPETCIVYGWVSDISGNFVKGTKISATESNSTTFVGSTKIVNIPKSTLTNSEGYFELELIHSNLLTPSGLKYTITITYPGSSYSKQIVVPSAPTALFSTL